MKLRVVWLQTFVLRDCEGMSKSIYLLVTLQTSLVYLAKKYIKLHRLRVTDGEGMVHISIRIGICNTIIEDSMR